MNEEILKDGNVGYAEGIERCLGKKELYEKILRAFARDNAILYARNAFDDSDSERLLFYVHEIKGSTGNMGLNKVYEPACRLYALVSSENCSRDSLGTAFEEMEKAYLSAKDTILRALED